MKKSIYMGSTSIDPQQTAGEIISELVRAGANSIQTDYENGVVVGLRWVMRINGHDALFNMPARVKALQRIIRDPAQARRTAWRQLLRWVQAQNAMIETGMVQASEVYFAYHVPAGQDQTLFDIAMERQFKALPAPEKPQ